MGELTASRAAETEALREAYAALNRNDIPATVTAFDPQIVWSEPAHYPGGGTYHGLEEVQALQTRARGTWAEGRQADVYTFRNGKAIQMRVFAYRRQALEWAGVKALDADWSIT